LGCVKETPSKLKEKLMTRIFLSTAIAALLASATFAVPALAEGDYYEGASKSGGASPRSANPLRADSTRTFGYPNQSGQSVFGKTTRDDRRAVDSGDYYEGASRPN
jgi:hypothetical protein